MTVEAEHPLPGLGKGRAFVQLQFDKCAVETACRRNALPALALLEAFRPCHPPATKPVAGGWQGIFVKPAVVAAGSAFDWITCHDV